MLCQGARWRLPLRGAHPPWSGKFSKAEAGGCGLALGVTASEVGTPAAQVQAAQGSLGWGHGTAVCVPPQLTHTGFGADHPEAWPGQRSGGAWPASGPLPGGAALRPIGVWEHREGSPDNWLRGGVEATPGMGPWWRRSEGAGGWSVGTAAGVPWRSHSSRGQGHRGQGLPWGHSPGGIR